MFKLQSPEALSTGPGRRAVLCSSVAFLLLVGAAAPRVARAADPMPVTLYKNPQCDCCEGYAAYLNQNGFKVTVIPSNDLEQIRKMSGVPDDLDGCHTTIMGQYVVEGHVPLEVIQRLLTEKPAIKGVSLPGMPSGTPGMPGPKDGPFKIYAFGNGASTLYATL